MSIIDMKKYNTIRKFLCVGIGMGLVLSQYTPYVHALDSSYTTAEQTAMNKVDYIQEVLTNASHIDDTKKEQLSNAIHLIPKYYDVYYTEESRAALENTLSELLQKIEDSNATFDDVYLSQVENDIQSGISALVYKTSSVPQIFITTEDGKGNELEKWIIDENGNEVEVGYKMNTEIAAVPEEGANDSTVLSRNDVGIKVRGNSTASGKKKPYNFKFPESQPVFGMDLSKTWSLLANHFDPTLLRNYIVFEFAQNIGLEYTPSQQFVELWMDGVYKGTYTLMQRASDTVEIQEGSQDFVIELDSRNEAGEQYITTGKDITFKINRPSNISDAQVENIRTVLQDVEAAIDSGDYNLVQEKIDVESFAKYYILNEYWKTLDIKVASVFFYYKNGKLYAGPIWDYDLSAGNVNATYANYHGDAANLYAYGSVWYPSLFKYEGFYNQVMSVFQANQSKMQEIYVANGKIDQALAKYRSSFDKNYTPVENGGAGWDVTYADDYIDYMYQPLSTYDENVEYFRNWMQERYEWMDAHLSTELKSKIEYNHPGEVPPLNTIEDCTITLDENTYVYDGAVKTPAVTVIKDGNALVENTDYTLSYTNNVNAGTATVTITGIGNYSGVVTKDFTIEKANQSLTLATNKDTIKVGESTSIKATSSIGNPTFTYASSDENVVTITQDGTIVGKTIGQATITVTAMGTENYHETSQTIDITVTAADLADYDITLSNTQYIYDGVAKTPTVMIQKDGVVLVKDTDYRVMYENNIDAGDARVVIEGIGNYTGTVNKIFTIAKADQPLTIKTDKENIKVGEIATLVASGAIGTVSYETSDSNIASVNGNGEVSGQAIGLVTITVTAAETSNYNATTATIEINVTAADAIDITDATITLDIDQYVYDGNAKEPVVSVEKSGTTLIRDSDYKVSYINNVNAGTATVTVTGIGSYIGIVTKDFIIEKANQSVTVTPSKDMIEVGEITALVVENAKGNITYQSANENIATVDDKGNITGIAEGSTSIYVTVEATANYHEATQTIMITVIPKSVVDVDIAISNITLDIDYYVYDGSEKTPVVTIEKDGVVLVEGVDYQVSYENNTNAGTARIIVTGIGNYTGTTTRNFTIAKGVTSLTIQGGLDKVYDGQAVQLPNMIQLGSQVAPTYKWYVKQEGQLREVVWVELLEAPSEIGTYKLVINVQEDANYVGAEEEIIFQIMENNTITPEVPPTITPDTPEVPPTIDDIEGSQNQDDQINGIQTGDTSRLGLWIVLASLSIAVLGFFINKKAKK